MIALSLGHLISGLRGDTQALPWREWIDKHFTAFATAPFADHHIEAWEWASSLQEQGEHPAFIACWPRGGGKSTTIELICAWLGSQPEPRRHYVLYVSETQPQADRHVQAIAGMLERVGISRAVNEYGASKGWKHTEIRASNGFNVTAMGLDSAMRGAKLDEYRPDLIVFDDVDARHDSAATIKKKIDTITTSILPTGSDDAAVIVVQNMIHESGIMAQLIDGTADFLHNRNSAQPIPAVRDLEYDFEIQETGRKRYRITGGEASWSGQTLEVCEKQMNEWGENAFLREAQHDVEQVSGGLWERGRDIDAFRATMLPDLERVVVGVDPNAGGADAAGIVVAGISHRWYDATIRGFRMADRPHAYVLEDMTTEGGSKAWAEAAVAAYHKYHADALIAERNNGGDMVGITIGTIAGAPPVELVWASRGKVTRAEPVQKLYTDGLVHHVGTHKELEKEMCTWKHPMPSPNRMDALVWALTELMIEEEGNWDEFDAYMRSQGVHS